MKIEPVTNNEARIHGIESKVQVIEKKKSSFSYSVKEQEEFFSYGMLFLKNTLKKLIYAIQKHNLKNDKITVEEELKEKRHTEQDYGYDKPPKSSVRGVLELLTEGNESPRLKKMILQNLNRNNLTALNHRRGTERINFPSIQREGILTPSSQQGAIDISNSVRSHQRNQSLEGEKLNSVRKEVRKCVPNMEVDFSLHQRLEVLRKLLVEETRISQNYSEMAADQQRASVQEKEAFKRVRH